MALGVYIRIGVSVHFNSNSMGTFYLSEISRAPGTCTRYDLARYFRSALCYLRRLLRCAVCSVESIVSTTKLADARTHGQLQLKYQRVKVRR